jgi:hypothetical protein
VERLCIESVPGCASTINVCVKGPQPTFSSVTICFSILLSAALPDMLLVLPRKQQQQQQKSGAAAAGKGDGA